MSKAWPRVLVGCPTYAGKAYCLERFAESVRAIDYPNFDVLLVDNSRDDGKFAREVERRGLPCIRGPVRKRPDGTIAASREILRRRAVREGYDYFFNLEQDVMVPPDTLTRLVSHQKDVVGGWYFVTKGLLDRHGTLTHYLKEPCVHVGTAKDDGRLRGGDSQALDLRLLGPGLLRVRVGSFGVCLMSTRVLGKFTFRPDAKGVYYDGTMFYLELAERRIPAYVDTELLVPHFQTYAHSNSLKNDQ